MSALAALWAGALALAAGALAVTRPNVVHALMWLVAMLLALAGAFFALGASFAGAVQILIYAGAVVAVFVFVVMTVDVTPATLDEERRRLGRAWRGPAAVAALVALPVVLGAGGGPEGDPEAVSARALGTLLFGDWALAVELASALLLAGLLGVRHLGRRARGEDAR